MNSNDLPQYCEISDLRECTKRRRRLSALETNLLSEVFSYNQKPNAQVRKELGQKLNMTPRAVQIWFQNKRAKVKKGNNSPIMDDHDQGNLFTPHKIENKGFIPTTLPTPPGSVFMRGNNFAQDSNDGSVYPSISPNLEFWNGDSSNGDLPTGPLSFVGSRSEIISKRPLFLDYFNSQNIQENLNNESPSSPVKLKSGNLDQEFYMKSSSKDESLIVNFMIPVPSGHHMASSDLLNESSNFENCYNIFRDSPERNLFHS